ncbi:SUR7/PalI family-domain-containing protein [Phellopilus nigrolimitatus]|nr:SUR7/PalI family-domain-containing protein [Phellopilus nigrolimitatus]
MPPLEERGHVQFNIRHASLKRIASTSVYEVQPSTLLAPSSLPVYRCLSPSTTATSATLTTTMARHFCIPGVFFLTCALVLLVLTSISLPTLTAFDITRVHFDTASSTSDASAINQIRFGIWAYCSDNADSGSRDCSTRGHAYEVQIDSPNNGNTVTIGSSWTRGLAIHPVAAAVTFLAFIFSFSQHVTLTLIASLLSFLAAIITLIAFACDIALLAFVRHELSDHLQNTSAQTITGPGFWLTFVSFILLLLAGCTVCFGRRRTRMDRASSSYPMTSTKTPFWRRFRRNY